MRSRAPRWLWALASTFVLYGSFISYTNHFGPEPIGAEFDFQQVGMMLLAIEPCGAHFLRDHSQCEGCHMSKRRE